MSGRSWCSRPDVASLSKAELGLQLVDHLRRLRLAEVVPRGIDLCLLAQGGEVGGLRAGHGIVTGNPILRILLRIRSRVLVQFGIVDMVAHRFVPVSVRCYSAYVPQMFPGFRRDPAS